jgi:hypothetical protein
MSEPMIVKVTLDEEDMKNLVTCMASMPGEVDGRPIAITPPSALREALRRMAEGERKRPRR